MSCASSVRISSNSFSENVEDATSSATTRKKLSGRKSIENRKSDSLKKDLKDPPPGKPTPNGLSNFWHLPAMNGT